MAKPNQCFEDVCLGILVGGAAESYGEEGEHIIPSSGSEALGTCFCPPQWERTNGRKGKRGLKRPFGTLLNLLLLGEESHMFCSGASLDLGMVGL